MLPHQSITLETLPAFRHYLAGQPFRTCDYTIGAIYQWRAYLHSTYAIHSGMLILTADYPGEGLSYSYPVGDGNMHEALNAIAADARERNVPLLFCAVPEEGVPVLRAHFGEGIRAESRRDWADYLYNAGDLIAFPGKKFHTQRNHFNRFLKENPENAFVPVTGETLDTAVGFLDIYAAHAPIDKVIEAEEMLRAEELLKNSLRLGMKAGYVTAGDQVVAVAVGEVIGDTLYVHVEKARLDFPGAYQAIVSMFARYAAEPDTLYINREDDSGEEGLRYSKLEYRPIRLVDKYWVSI